MRKVHAAELVPRGRGVALVEHEVQHVADRGDPVGAVGRGRRREPRPRRGQLLLGAADPRAHRRLADAVGVRDLAGAEPTHGSQRQSDLGHRAERRVAAEQQQREAVVVRRGREERRRRPRPAPAHVGAEPARTAAGRPCVGSPRGRARIVGSRAPRRRPTACWPRAAPPGRRPPPRRTCRTGARAPRGPAVPRGAAGSRWRGPGSCGEVGTHDRPDLDRLAEQVDDAGDDVDGAFLGGDVDDGEAGEDLLQLGERSVGGDDAGCASWSP